MQRRRIRHVSAVAPSSNKVSNSNPTQQQLHVIAEVSEELPSHSGWPEEEDKESGMNHSRDLSWNEKRKSPDLFEEPKELRCLNSWIGGVPRISFILLLEFFCPVLLSALINVEKAKQEESDIVAQISIVLAYCFLLGLLTFCVLSSLTLLNDFQELHKFDLRKAHPVLLYEVKIQKFSQTAYYPLFFMRQVTIVLIVFYI